MRFVEARIRGGAPPADRSERVVCVLLCLIGGGTRLRRNNSLHLRDHCTRTITDAEPVSPSLSVAVRTTSCVPVLLKVTEGQGGSTAFSRW